MVERIRAGMLTKKVLQLEVVIGPGPIRVSGLRNKLSPRQPSPLEEKITPRCSQHPWQVWSSQSLLLLRLSAQFSEERSQRSRQLLRSVEIGRVSARQRL